MNQSLRTIVFVSIFTLALQGIAQADSLKGRVLDPQGENIADAQIRLFDRKTGELRTTSSSSDGQYQFLGISAGNYLLEGAASSAALTAAQQIQVEGDQNVD